MPKFYHVLRLCRADVANTIGDAACSRLTDEMVEYLADKVGDALAGTYWDTIDDICAGEPFKSWLEEV